MSHASETTRLKTALSASLDRIEYDNERIAEAERYLAALQAQAVASDKALATAKKEIAALGRLRALDEAESLKLRIALAHADAEGLSLRDAIAQQEKTIIKQNERLAVSKKITKLVAIVSIAAGILIGVKVGR